MERIKIKQYEVGSFVHIGSTKSVWQIVEFVEEIEPELNNFIDTVYLARKVFNKSLVFKPEKAEIVSASYMWEIEKPYMQKVEEAIENDDKIKKFIEEASKESKFTYKYIQAIYCFDDKVKNILDALNDKSGEYIDLDFVERKLKELQKKKEIENAPPFTGFRRLKNGENVYYVEGGAFEIELYKHKQTKFREIKLVKKKI